MVARRFGRAFAALLIAASTVPAAAQAPIATELLTVDPARMDTTCLPCADFYGFANGSWLRSTSIPPDREALGAYGILAARNDSLLAAIIGAAAERAGRRTVPPPAPGGTDNPERREWVIGTLFAACMDTVGVERNDLRALRPAFRAIDGVRTTRQLARVLATVPRLGGYSPFAASVQPDPRASNSHIVTVHAGGHWLPRDYYLAQDARTSELRAEYREHIRRMLELSGVSAERARPAASGILELETRLAGASLPPEIARIPDSTYNRVQRAALASYGPALDWDALFAAWEVRDPPPYVNVTDPRWLLELNAAIADVPLDTWRLYLRWRTLRNYTWALPVRFEEEARTFDARLGGASSPRERSIECAGSTRGILDRPVSQLFVDHLFSPRAKHEAQQLVEELRRALRARLTANDWMSGSTRDEALRKIDALVANVGYPDQWPDSSAYSAVPGDYLGSFLVISLQDGLRRWRQLDEPVNRDVWPMAPSRVNAFYDRARNRITIPAAILRPPFFDATADPASNLGAIGAVIGHELTHGFDDEGRQFDASGSRRDWWTEADAARFQDRAERLVEQYDAYYVIDTTARVNGRVTLGENLADLGGVILALDVLKQRVPDLYSRGADGFSPLQRFFLAYAQTWREVRREESARRQVRSGVHSPARWRANGPLANLPEFHRAWGCGPGDPMYIEEARRAEIW